jgi:RIO kinase 1
VLVHDDRLVLSDLPQVVDVVGNPQGPAFLARGVARIVGWFTARGMPAEVGDGLLGLLRREVGLDSQAPRDR